jgi:hypothetical protein
MDGTPKGYRNTRNRMQPSKIKVEVKFLKKLNALLCCMHQSRLVQFYETHQKMSSSNSKLNRSSA